MMMAARNQGAGIAAAEAARSVVEKQDIDASVNVRFRFSNAFLCLCPCPSIFRIDSGQPVAPRALVPSAVRL
jgi:hypothetical protein